MARLSPLPTVPHGCAVANRPHLLLPLLIPIKNKLMLNINIQKNPENNTFVLPAMLGMEKTIELTCARAETFFYRRMNKRLIDYKVIDDRRWNKIRGPLVYAVTDKYG